MAHSESDQDSPALVIGVEIAGRGHRVVLGRGDGQILDVARAIDPDATATASATIETVCGLIEQVLRRSRTGVDHVTGIGVAFGGPVDAKRGITIRSHRISGFEQLPLVGVLEDRFGLRTVIENDARAAALGEFTYGAGRGARDMVYLHLGSGVGGGLVIDGRLHHGVSMTSGELGHMVVSTDGPRCSCGKPGHLEAYASETAIISRMRERLSSASPRAKARWLANAGVTVERIFESRGCDADARFIVDETVQVIGLAGANLVTAMNPDAFVMGGHVVEVAPDLIPEVRAKIRQYAFDAAAHRVVVAAGQLRGNAGLMGALVLATSH